MSIRVMSLVWDGFPGGGSDLLAMLALADWSDDEGRCWPSVASIASKIRLGDKQARRIVHGLEAAGYLAVTANAAGGATSRRYQIVLGRLTPPAHGSPPISGSPPAGVPAPSRGREPTPPAHGSRTVIDTSISASKPTSGDVGCNQAKSDRKSLACPHDQIIALYHELLPANPQIRKWTPTRAAHLRARWAEDKSRQNIEYWKRFFTYVAESDFLTGRAASSGRRPFTPGLEWLVRDENFTKIREGRYHQESAA